MTVSRRWQYGVYGSIAAIALVIRVWFLWHGPIPTVVYDAKFYDDLAQGMLQHLTFGLDNTPTAYTTPGYPLFLAAIYKVSGLTDFRFTVVRYAQVLLSTASVLLTALTARRLAGFAAGAVAGLVAALYPPAWEANALILTEPLFVFLLALFFYMISSDPLVNWRKSLALGLVGGFTILVRNTVAPFMLVWMLIWMLSQRKTVPWRSLVIRAAPYAMGVLLLMMPWWVRNFAQFKTFIPFATQSSNVMYAGSFLNNEYPPMEQWPQVHGELASARLMKEVVNQRLRDVFSREPVRYARWYLVEKPTILLERPYIFEAFGLLSEMINIHRVLVWAAALGTALVLFACRTALGRDLAAFAIMYVCLHIPFLTLDRYGFPLVATVGTMLAAAALVETCRYLVGRPWLPKYGLIGGLFGLFALTSIPRSVWAGVFGWNLTRATWFPYLLLLLLPAVGIMWLRRRGMLPEWRMAACFSGVLFCYLLSPHGSAAAPPGDWRTYLATGGGHVEQLLRSPPIAGERGVRTLAIPLRSGGGDKFTVSIQVNDKTVGVLEGKAVSSLLKWYDFPIPASMYGQKIERVAVSIGGQPDAGQNYVDIYGLRFGLLGPAYFNGSAQDLSPDPGIQSGQFYIEFR